MVWFFLYPEIRREGSLSPVNSQKITLLLQSPAVKFITNPEFFTVLHANYVSNYDLLSCTTDFWVPDPQGECTMNLNCATWGSVILSEHQTRLGTLQPGCSKEALAGILPHVRDSMVQRSLLILSSQKKQEPLVSAWLILLSVPAGSEFVACWSNILRNPTQIPPRLRETEGKKINSCNLHSQKGGRHNWVKGILTCVSVAIFEKAQMKTNFENSNNFFFFH